MTESTWKLTYDPGGADLVLLDFGQLIETDIVWASRRSGGVVDLLDSPTPFLRDDRNVSLTASWQVEHNEATKSDTLKRLMNDVIAHQALEKKPLKIEAEGVVECYWIAAAALLQNRTKGVFLKGRYGSYSVESVVMAGITEVDTGISPLAVALPSPVDAGDFGLVATSAAAPGSFMPSDPSPVDAGDFGLAATSAAAPGSFMPSDPSPVDAGDFGLAATSAADPGRFTAGDSSQGVSALVISGILVPDATGIIPFASAARWAHPLGGTTVTWDDTASRWQILHPTLPGFVTWVSDVTTPQATPLPWLATGWVPGVGIVAPAPTGTPVVTAQN